MLDPTNPVPRLFSHSQLASAASERHASHGRRNRRQQVGWTAAHTRQSLKFFQESQYVGMNFIPVTHQTVCVILEDD